MRRHPQRALLVLFLFAAQSGCTLLYGDREPAGSGGNDSGNGGSGSSIGGNVGSGGNGGNGGGGGGGGGGAGGGGGTCVPTRCADVGAVCGTITDGCGGMLSCGDCANGQTCGGAGANRCGTGACVPQTCQQLGATCGQFSDGCAGVVDCGACAAGSWSSIGTFSYNFVAVAYDTSGLWVAEESGNVVHSTDDTHFTLQKVQNGLSTLYADGGDVWAGGGDGISHKSPSATSFTLLAGSPGFVQSIHGVAGSLYAVTDDLSSGIYHSTDAGATWSKVSVGATLEIFALWGSGSLVVGATEGRFVRSTDAGATWTESVYGYATYHGLSGTGASDIWAVGAGSDTTVLHSTDGAASWTPDTGFYGALPLYGVSAGATKQYAVGDSGAILVRTN